MTHEIKIPRLGINEDCVIITEWYVKDKEWVEKDRPICSVETEKTVTDLVAEKSGYIRTKIQQGEKIRVQEVIGYIVGSLDTAVDMEKKSKSEELVGSSNQKVKATRKAKELARELGINIQSIGKKRIVREKDVKEYHAGFSMMIKKKSLSLPKERKPIAIYGAGRGGIVAKECAELMGKYEVVCFIDDDLSLVENKVHKVPVFSGADLKKLKTGGIYGIFVAIANGQLRIRLKEDIKNLDLEVVNLVHPESFISPSVVLGQGVFIKAGALIDANTTIGNCCLIDNGVAIAHDNIIEDGCHIAPGVSLGSDVIIGSYSVIGIGASVSTGVKIGKNVVVAIGSSVVTDIPDKAVVEGVPGKLVGKRK